MVCGLSGLDVLFYPVVHTVPLMRCSWGSCENVSLDPVHREHSRLMDTLTRAACADSAERLWSPRGSFHGEAGWPVQHGSRSATARTQAVASRRRPCWNTAPLGTQTPGRCAGDDESQVPSSALGHEDHPQASGGAAQGVSLPGQNGGMQIPDTFGPGWRMCQ